jgi:hypothetical protein
MPYPGKPAGMVTEGPVAVSQGMTTASAVVSATNAVGQAENTHGHESQRADKQEEGIHGLFLPLRSAQANVAP